VRRARHYTPEDEFIVRKLYPRTSNAEIAEIIGRTPRNVGQFARKLGLKKSPAYIERAKPGQFHRGQTPPNKGLRRPGWAPGRMASTQFKTGRPASEARNYVPVGSLRVTKDGYLERKVTDDASVYPARRWVAAHRLVWEAAHGPIPAGHVAVFKPGCRTTDVERITPDAVELVTRAELMRRNTFHRLPPELREVIQLTGALKRKINNRSKDRAERRP
jgi:hypothetical protein